LIHTSEQIEHWLTNHLRDTIQRVEFVRYPMSEWPRTVDRSQGWAPPTFPVHFDVEETNPDAVNVVRVEFCPGRIAAIANELDADSGEAFLQLIRFSLNNHITLFAQDMWDPRERQEHVDRAIADLDPDLLQFMDAIQLMSEAM